MIDEAAARHKGHNGDGSRAIFSFAQKLMISRAAQQARSEGEPGGPRTTAGDQSRVQQAAAWLFSRACQPAASAAATTAGALGGGGGVFYL